MEVESVRAATTKMKIIFLRGWHLLSSRLPHFHVVSRRKLGHNWFYTCYFFLLFRARKNWISHHSRMWEKKKYYRKSSSSSNSSRSRSVVETVQTYTYMRDDDEERKNHRRSIEFRESRGKCEKHFTQALLWASLALNFCWKTSIEERPVSSRKSYDSLSLEQKSLFSCQYFDI